MNEIIVTNLQKAFQIIWPVILTLASGMVASYFSVLRKKVKSSKGEAALQVFDRVVENAVIAVNQSIVKRIKRKHSRSLTEDEKKTCKSKATDTVNFCLSAQVKNDVKYIVKDLDRYLDNTIEGKVVEQKENRRRIF